MKQAALIFCAAVMLGLFSWMPAFGADPVVIPAILSLTGPGSFLGKNEQDAFRLIEDQVNREGGIGGRPIQFEVQDDQSNPQVAVQLANGLIARKVPVILGPSLTATCSAIAPLAVDGPVIYCFSAGMQPVHGSYMFAFGISTTELLAMNVSYLRDRGLRKIAILTSTDASGQDGERAINAALARPENKDIAVVAREYYGVTDLSAVAQITRIKQSGAQVLIAWGTGTPIATVLRGINDVGLDIPVCIAASNDIYAEMKQYQSILPRELISAGFPVSVVDSLPAGPVKAAVQRFIDAFNAIGVQADLSQSNAWDPSLLVVEAFRRLGPTATAAQIRSYIEGVHGWAGVNGIYDFRIGDQRGLTIQTAGIMNRWDPSKDTWIAVSKLGGAVR